MQGHHGDGHHAHIPSSSSCEKNMGEKTHRHYTSYNIHFTCYPYFMSKLSENWIYVALVLLDKTIYYTKSGSVVMSLQVKSLA